MADADYEAEPRFDEDERRGYDSRDRSRSPRGDGGESGVRARSASPNGRDRYESRDGPAADNRSDEANTNPGSNLFVTGIAPRLSEQDVTEMFGKYGEVEKCNIMRDPHTSDSRGFGFVKMVTPDGADAARDALSGQLIEGRTLSVEKARRGRPRTPTPGKYYGPPKREGGPPFRGGRGGGGGGGRRFDSYDDRRGGDRGYGRRDDYGGGSRGGRDRGGYSDRRDDRYGGGGDAYYGSGGGGGGGGYSSGGGGSRSYGGGRDREYDGGRERVDRYASGPPREERRGYSGGGGGSGGGDDRRGYGGSSGGGYPREDRGGSGYGDAAAPRDREPYQGSRG